jgi:hypothetical protein
VTFTAGAIAAPALVAVGPVVKASCVTTPGATLKVGLAADVSPDAAAWSENPAPLLSMLNELKLATPSDALTVVVPESVAPGVPVPLMIDIVIALAKSVAV